LKLIDPSGRLICPRCEESFVVSRFRQMVEIEAYKEDTLPILKCPECFWIFSPGPHVHIALLHADPGRNFRPDD